MSGVPCPLKVGGLRPPTFPGTSGMGLRSMFLIFEREKFEEFEGSGARFLIPKFLIRPVGSTPGDVLGRESGF